ncbi:hypothetical protein [Geomonas sp.]|uniref:hypothetical protein n=1 Tax=Geomonas sp. TaxID=2651584 RepID=UPI002B4692AD|nr:hypothetical protein [Geomonas sp.]HJV34514.1 hypothetical protein [Geomonas sp.]
MSSVLPEGEDLRRAVKWVSGHLLDDPDHPLQPLIQEAVFKFDLSPRDAELLISFYRKNKTS